MQLSDGMIIVLGLFLFVAGAAVQRYALPTVHAQGVTRTIPKVWGACRGALAGSLIMEDANGTIRIIDPEDGRVLIFSAHHASSTTTMAIVLMRQ